MEPQTSLGDYMRSLQVINHYAVDIKKYKPHSVDDCIYVDADGNRHDEDELRAEIIERLKGT